MDLFVLIGNGAQELVVNLLASLFCIVFLLLVVPYICVSVRRLHDIGRSGLWLLLGGVPIANIVVLVFTLMPSQANANEYGDNPLAKEANHNVNKNEI